MSGRTLTKQIDVLQSNDTWRAAVINSEFLENSHLKVVTNTLPSL